MIIKKKTKIIATVGPATESPKQVEEMAKNGVNVFRLNFSHDSHENHIARIKTIRLVEKKIGKPLAVLVDLQGPKMRIGDIAGDSMNLKKGNMYTFTVDKAEDGEIFMQYKKIINEIKKGDRILLDDGKLEVIVTSIKSPKIYAKVIVGGQLSSKKGMSFPDTEISCKVFTKKDKDDLVVALKNDVEFIAISFVKNAKDLKEIRGFAAKRNKKIKIVSKIERHEALKNIDELIRESDAIMVARGDLGIEVALDQVTLMQKDIVKKCISAGKPVIVATQMLESMIKSPVPTRAEVSDIANAVLDGADAVMLSAETSVGQYPIAAIRTMRNIAIDTENWAMHKNIFIGKSAKKEIDNTAEAIGKSACALVYDTKAKLIINATATGRTSRAVSNYRPYAPIVSITHDIKTARELQLVWGVYSRPIKYSSVNEMVKKAIKAVMLGKMVKKGDKVVVIAGHKTGIPGTIDTLQVKVL
jgi:pyruvate kinase